MKPGKRAIVVACCGLVARWAEGAALPEIEKAIAPLADGVPEVAVARLEELARAKLSPDADAAVLTALAEAFLAAGRPADALRAAEDPALRASIGANFSRAHALAALGRWPEAAAAYEQMAGDQNNPRRADALFGQAEALRAQGKNADALHVFERLFADANWGVRARLRAIELYLEQPDVAAAARLLEHTETKLGPERKERRLLRGRIEVASNHREKAEEIFESIVQKPEGAAHAVFVSALFALADLHLQMNTPEAGDDFLENFIEHHPADAALAEVFAKLDQLYRAERKPSRRELVRWAGDPEQPRRGLAQWYLARTELRAGRREEARQFFGELLANPGTSAALAEAFLECAQMQRDDRQFDDALKTLQAARRLPLTRPQVERIDFEAARIEYLAGHFDAAASGYETLAHASPAYAAPAFFNGSLAALRLGNSARFLVDAAELTKLSGDEDARAELALQRGLVQAGQNDPHASASLEQFVRDFPQNARVSEALVALAEIEFHASPPRIDQARRSLERAAQAKPTDAARERAAYLNIWMEDAAGEGAEAKVIALANDFLRQFVNSPFASDVRLKLGETYYRRQDFANAQTQFELVAQQTPPPPLLERALFLAGESAMQSMGPQALDRALTLFDQVVKRNGDLRWAARNEQAAIERRLGKPQDALALYEEVLKSEARAADKREALCGKGDVYFELGSADAANYRRALEIFEQLANTPEISAHWRNQALFKKGTCLDRVQDRNGALAAFYQVLEEEMRPERLREFFWFYKAGFNAARLLEEDSKWDSAAAVYQKLVASAGSRSEEARERLARLRLEHFLWER